MRVRFSYRTEKGKLPDAVTLMETTRKLHEDMKKNPIKFWENYEEWFKPMNQLQNGAFMSITQDTRDFEFVEYYNGESSIKLEYYQLGPNYAKILFDFEESLPYRIPSGKTTIETKSFHLK